MDPLTPLSLLLAGSPWAQILFEVAAGGELVGVVATRAAGRTLLLAEDVRGRPLAEVLRPDMVRTISEGFRDSLQLGEAVSHESFATTQAGEVWGMTTVSPIFDDRGVAAYVLVSFLELDFVARTEAALARAEASLRRLVDASSDAILVVVDGRVTSANAAAARRFEADLVGCTTAEVLDLGIDPISVPLSDGAMLLVVRAGAGR